MKKDDLVYVEDILESINTIEAHIGKITLEQFLSDIKTSDAVLRRFEIIGEAARRLSEEFVAKHPDFPISLAVAMRNFLTHEYKKIDYKIIWDSVKVDLPKLKSQTSQILENGELQQFFANGTPLHSLQ